MSPSGDIAAATSGAHFDFVIVGGGSAGCVLAARLSEVPSRRVALIEAGPDFEPGSEPDFVRDPRTRAIFAHQLFWPNLVVEAAPARGDIGPTMVPMPQARVLGGGSVINGMHAQRGEEADYDEWRQHGVIGWGWKDVQPFFRRVEDDLDFGGSSDGPHGPIKIRRYGPETWSALSLALANAFEARGLRRAQNVNARGGESIASVPLNAAGERFSASVGYLTREVRSRKNLAILSNTAVKRLLFKDRRVTGVELLEPSGKEILGSNVILSCGSVHSPAMLQRSGVGPGAMLASAGIPILADRRGVGQKLQNHPLINAVTARLTRKARARGIAPAPCLMVVRYSSGQPDCPPADMLLNLWERLPGSLARDPLLGQFAGFMVVLNKTFSEGTVALDPAQPFGSPKVRFDPLGDFRDRERIMRGIQMVATVTASEEFRGLITDRLALKPNPMMAMLLQDTWRAGLLSEIGSIVMDFSGPFRGSLLRQVGTPIETILADPRELEKFVLAMTEPGGHPTGTCRLGDPSHEDTVVDSRCRVVGVEGVHVVDASIFPTPLRAGTNLPTMMAGEKAAAMINEDTNSSHMVSLEEKTL